MYIPSHLLRATALPLARISSPSAGKSFFLSSKSYPRSGTSAPAILRAIPALVAKEAPRKRSENVQHTPLFLVRPPQMRSIVLLSRKMLTEMSLDAGVLFIKPFDFLGFTRAPSTGQNLQISESKVI